MSDVGRSLLVRKRNAVEHFDDLVDREIGIGHWILFWILDWPPRSCNVRNGNRSGIAGCQSSSSYGRNQPEKLNMFALTNDFSTFGNVSCLASTSNCVAGLPFDSRPTKLEYSRDKSSFGNCSPSLLYFTAAIRMSCKMS